MDFSNIEKVYNQRNGETLNKEDFMKYFQTTYLSKFTDEAGIVVETINNAFLKISERMNKQEYADAKECCFEVALIDDNMDFSTSPCIYLSSTYFTYKLEGCELSRYWTDHYLRFTSENPRKTFKVSLPTKRLQTVTITEKDIEIMKQYVNSYNCLQNKDFFKSSDNVAFEITELLRNTAEDGYIKLCKEIDPNIIWTDLYYFNPHCFKTKVYFSGSETGNYKLAEFQFNSSEFHGSAIWRNFKFAVQKIILEQMPTIVTDQIIEELIISKIQKSTCDKIYAIDFNIYEEERENSGGINKNRLVENGVEFLVDENQLKISLDEVTFLIEDTNLRLRFPVKYEETVALSDNLSKYILSFYQQFSRGNFEILPTFFDFPKKLKEVLRDKGISVWGASLSNTTSWTEVQVTIDNPAYRRN